jgi:hypothetical protein
MFIEKYKGKEVHRTHRIEKIKNNNKFEEGLRNENKNFPI